MGILRGVSGKVLDCGCLVGVYETYSGGVVQVIDAIGPACTHHRKGQTVPGSPSVKSASPDAPAASRDSRGSG